MLTTTNTVGLKSRDYLIEEYTKTVCPACFAEGKRASDQVDTFKDGLIVSHHGKIWLRRFCQIHGETESLYEEDAEIWHARDGWSTPTLAVTPDRPNNYAAFPEAYRLGLPASHGQHTCILVLNITERCNFSCPTCYASAKSPDTAVDAPETPTVEEICKTVKTVIDRENGKLGVLMLSGGEPTVRTDLPDIIQRLLDYNITRIMINTNGRRIARDDKFLEFLSDNRGRVEVYLQFDGFRPQTHMSLRGENVIAEKLLALQRLDQAGIFTTLVTTVQRGVNDDEVGKILLLGLDTPRCSGMAIQPVFGSGRLPTFDPLDRVTPTGILRRLGEQTNGLIDWHDFLPLPCSHKDCCDITYLVKTADGNWQSIPKLIGKDQLKQWIHMLSNTISFQDLPAPVENMLKQGVLQRVFSEQLKVGSSDIARDLAQMCGCVPGLNDNHDSPVSFGPNHISSKEKTSASDDAMYNDNLVSLNDNRVFEQNCTSNKKTKVSAVQTAENTFRITCKMFMDAHTFHEARIRQCCVHTGTFEKDPRRYSFCWRWLFSDASDFPDSEQGQTMKVHRSDSAS